MNSCKFVRINIYKIWTIGLRRNIFVPNFGKPAAITKVQEYPNAIQLHNLKYIMFHRIDLTRTAVFGVEISSL
jgi:hypothetical protein